MFGRLDVLTSIPAAVNLRVTLIKTGLDSCQIVDLTQILRDRPEEPGQPTDFKAICRENRVVPIPARSAALTRCGVTPEDEADANLESSALVSSGKSK